MTTRGRATSKPNNKRPMAGKVQTVLGPIEPEQLGITLAHEHLLLDLTCFFKVPEAASEREWIDAPVSIERRGTILARWAYNRDSMGLLDERVAIEEVSRYKYAGGQSLVEATSIGIARDPLALARISRATGLNIVMGASHYVPLAHPADMDKRSEDSIFERIVRDVTVGVGDTGVRSGIIGEVGNLWPITENERKVLRASARAQKETGASILIHPGAHPDSPLFIMKELVKAGADPERVVLGHLDVFNDKAWAKRLAETGCCLEWDNFGIEDTNTGPVAHQQIELMSDVQRMDMIQYLIGEGYGGKIVVSQDVCFKFSLGRYGGKPYNHIMENIVPRMRKRGFTEKHINDILVENPKRILTFV